MVAEPVAAAFAESRAAAVAMELVLLGRAEAALVPVVEVWLAEPDSAVQG